MKSNVFYLGKIILKYYWLNNSPTCIEIYICKSSAKKAGEFSAQNAAWENPRFFAEDLFNLKCYFQDIWMIFLELLVDFWLSSVSSTGFTWIIKVLWWGCLVEFSCLYMPGALSIYKYRSDINYSKFQIRRERVKVVGKPIIKI